MKCKMKILHIHGYSSNYRFSAGTAAIFAISVAIPAHTKKSLQAIISITLFMASRISASVPFVNSLRILFSSVFDFPEDTSEAIPEMMFFLFVLKDSRLFDDSIFPKKEIAFMIVFIVGAFTKYTFSATTIVFP